MIASRLRSVKLVEIGLDWFTEIDTNFSHDCNCIDIVIIIDSKLGSSCKLNRSALLYDTPCEWPLSIIEDDNVDEEISNPPCCGDMDGMDKEEAAEHLLLPVCFQ